MAHRVPHRTYHGSMTTHDIPDLPITAMLGVGSMGGAILHGLLAPTARITSPVRVTTHSEASAATLREHPDVMAHALETRPDANREAVRGAKLIILGVKPWMVHDVLTDVADAIDPHAVVVSVAAGIPIARMQSLLRPSVSVVRAMPNTPSLVGRGVTGIVGSPDGAPHALDLAERLFATVGEVIRVDSEAQLDQLSAISGSGPAYVFLFIEKLTAAAERLGFSHAQAKRMAEGTFLGASLLLEDQQVDPAELRRRVTSPQGTTERAISAFQAADLDRVFDDALAAAIARAQELATDV